MVEFLLARSTLVSRLLLPVLVILTLTDYRAAIAQSGPEFDPELLSQSTVRILIKHGSRIVSSATGFIWQENNQIVTALHVMHPDPSATIIVEFEKLKRRAKIKAVLPGADLVLLHVDRPITGWVPLLAYTKNKPKYKAEVSALGFNRGSTGMSTRELRKGYVKPETLQVLLPPAALKSLVRSKTLDINLPIYYLDGSLLPGYSGSPIVDSSGALIGIGDGGLENGAAGVSWVIPARHLDQLSTALSATLPASINLIHETFSADNFAASTDETAKAITTKPTIESLFRSLKSEPYLYASIEAHEASTAGDDGEDERLQEAYREVLYRDFTFVRTKSRTYEQMLRSSSHPRGFEKVLAIYHELFEGYLIDYSNFTFDIYEDSPSGLNIVIPEGTELTVANGKHLLVKGSMFCRRCPYEIQYFVRRLPTDSAQLINQSPSVFLNAMADEHWQELNQEGSYSEYSDIRDIEEYGDNRYVLRAAFSDFDAPFQNRYEVNYYTAAVNQETWFQVEGILNRFDDKFLKQLRVQGSDCRVDDLSKKETRICNDVKMMMKILISVHLTSFSNKFMQSNHTT